ncbi:bacteriohemerythrin [Wansuia hejianensis]|uniref:Hemerythrin family protein n=1 Tax=Wansuia hejianensis TaxID=2763667 RepID=A0A926ING7_9FIRM|nr:hemerythrin family protein [Wansuia hejianensis]MBC8591435.1 hemerythrin family protein [Wansuia hejianensis]
MMWKDKYLIGVEKVDQQHKELFKNLGDFIKLVQNKEVSWEDRLDKAKETLDFLQGYVVFHFDDEEKYQESIDYPNIEEHKQAHKAFKEGINEYVEIFKEGGFTEEKMQEFSAKLMTWLIMHVGKMDQKIGEYVKSREVNA